MWRRIRKQMCLLSKIKPVHEQGNRKDHKPERPVQTNFHRTPPFSYITVSYKYYIIRTNDYLLIHDSEGQPLLNSSLWKLLNPSFSLCSITTCKTKKLWMKCAENTVTYEISKAQTHSFTPRNGKRWQVFSVAREAICTVIWVLTIHFLEIWFDFAWRMLLIITSLM